MRSKIKLFDNIKSYYLSIEKKSGVKYLKTILLSFLLLLIISVGFLINYFYVQRIEEKAAVGFLEVVEFFNNRLNEKKIDKNWDEVLVFIDSLYLENKNSKLAPFFLAYKVKVLIEQGKSPDELLVVLKSVLKAIKKNSLCYSFFSFMKLKVALDSNILSVRAEALKDLIALTVSEKSYNYIDACYLIGFYFLNNGEFEQAKTYFNKIIAAEEKEKAFLIKSPYFAEVHEILQSI